MDECDKSIVRSILGDSDDNKDEIYKKFLEIIHHDECTNKSEKTAEKLIELGCPLWKAVLLGNAEVVEHMIINGSPIDSMQPYKHFTALIKAVQLMDVEMVSVLTKYGANLDLCDKWGKLPIAHYDPVPGRIQRPEIIKMLLNETVSLKNLSKANLARQLKKCFAYGNREVIRMLLEFDDNILNIADIDGQTPLHYLSGNHHFDITKELQGRKIDVNVRDSKGRTPLFTATEKPGSHISTFQFLLKNGADVNAATNYPETPLFSLCHNPSLKKGTFIGIVEILLQYDVDIQYIGSNRTTVFDVIEKNNTLFMAQPILAQLAIREEQGKPVNELVLERINSHSVFKKCFDNCKAELAKMKNHVINKNLTLHKILVNRMSEEQILKDCKFSPNSVSKFKKLKKKFHVDDFYYAIVDRCISPVVSKLELKQKAAPLVCKLLQLGIDANHLVILEIINYLNRRDLSTLLKVKL